MWTFNIAFLQISMMNCLADGKIALGFLKIRKLIVICIVT